MERYHWRPTDHTTQLCAQCNGNLIRTNIAASVNKPLEVVSTIRRR
jgi:hypothetical protein